MLLPFNFSYYFIYFFTKYLFAFHDFLDLRVQLFDVHDLPRVLRLHIGADGQVVVVFGDLVILRQMGEVGHLLALCEGVHDALDVFGGQLVVV